MNGEPSEAIGRSGSELLAGYLGATKVTVPAVPCWTIVASSRPMDCGHP